MFDTVDSNHLAAIVHVADGDCGHEKPFDYESLMPEQAQAIRACGARIRTETRRIAESVITIGRELIAVKNALRHGAFAAWVKSECGFSVRSAQNYMRVARFADKNATVAHLPLGTSYRLWGRRTTRWMLTAAAERAVDGKDPTEAEVERLYRMFRNSTTRRARRRSRGLAPSVGVRTSEQNSRSCIAQPGNFEASCEDSPSRAELAEQRAQWILTRCGEEFAKSLVAMRDVGGLDDAMRVLKQKLVAIKQKREPAGR